MSIYMSMYIYIYIYTYICIYIYIYINQYNGNQYITVRERWKKKRKSEILQLFQKIISIIIRH